MDGCYMCGGTCIIYESCCNDSYCPICHGTGYKAVPCPNH